MDEYSHLANMALVLTPTLYSGLVSAAAGAVYGSFGSMMLNLNTFDGAMLGLLGLMSVGIFEAMIFSILMITAKLADNHHLKNFLLFDRTLAKNHHIAIKLSGVIITDASLNTFIASWVGMLLYQLQSDKPPSIHFYQMLFILTSAYALLGGILLSKNKYYVARKASLHFFNNMTSSESTDIEQSDTSYNSYSNEYESLENSNEDRVSQDPYLDTEDLEIIRY